MAPKKRPNIPYFYHSSDDEDYCPSENTPLQPSTKFPRSGHDGVLPPTSQLRRSSTANGAQRHLRFNVPQEILHIILTHACKNDGAVPMAQVAMCVSRAWRDAVATCPALFAAVDLSSGQRHPPKTIMAKQCHMWSAMRSLSLSGCGAVSVPGLAAVADACPLLQTLDLSYCTGMRAEGLADALFKMAVRPEEEDGSSAPLRSLNLSFVEVLPLSSGLDAVLRSVLLAQTFCPGEPTLEELVVEHCPRLSQTPFQDVCEASAVVRTPLLSALTMLSLSGSGETAVDFQLNMLELQLAAPNLVHLDLRYVSPAFGWKATHSSASIDKEFGAAAETVIANAGWHGLKVCRLTRFGGSGMLAVLAQMLCKAAALEELSLVGFKQIDWVDLAVALPQHTAWPGLKRLSMTGVFNTYFKMYDTSPCLLTSFSSFLVLICPWVYGALEELNVMGTGTAFDDESCAILAGCRRLLRVDARDTSVTDAGVRYLVESARKRGCLSELELDIAGCRRVSRGVRQAALRGVDALVQALGLM